MTARPACAVLLALALVAAGGGSARAAWSSPETVPGSDDVQAPGPAIAFAASGRSLITWRAGLLRPDEAQRAERTQRSAPGAYGTPLAISGLAADPVAFAQTRVALLRLRGLFPRMTLTADIGRLTSASGPDRTLARDEGVGGPPVLAGNARGDLVAAWTKPAGAHEHLDISLRHPGGRFGPPHVLRGSGRLAFPAAAYGDRGDTLVAYQRTSVDAQGRTRREVEARLRRPGHGFGSPQVLGATHGLAWIATAIAPTGRAYVVWAEQDGGEEANQSLTVHATLAAPSHHLFNRARELARSPLAARPQGRPRLVVDRAGNATAAWSLPTSATTARIDTAAARAGSWFAAPATVAADGILQDIAGAPDGAALVLWTGAFGATFAPRPVAAAYRPAGASAFAAAESVAPDPEDPGDAAAAFDASGRPVVTWIGRPGFRGEFPPAEPRVVRVAQRD
jgi:hypothetical protein